MNLARHQNDLQREGGGASILWRIWHLPLRASFFYALCAVAYVTGLARTGLALLRHPEAGHFLDWKLTQFYVNYLDFGFVKRGLVGTALLPIFRTVGSDVSAAKLCVVALDTALFALLLTTFTRRLLPSLKLDPRAETALRWLLILSPVGVMQYAFDIGRYDHLNYFLAGGAIWLAWNRQIVLAGAVAALGILVHEAMVVYALPLLTAVCVDARWRRVAFKDTAAELASLLALPLLVTALLVVRGGDADILHALPAPLAQGAGAWNRGVVQINSSLGTVQLALILFYTISPYALLMGFYTANGRKPDLLYLSTLAPLALFSLGVDYARWTELLFLTSFAALVVNAGCRRFPRLPAHPAWRTLLFLYLLPLGPIGVTRALPYLDSLSRGPLASALGFSAS